MATVYGVVSRSGEYFDVSTTERGAKNYATRNGYTEVYQRINCGYHVDLIASKQNGKWEEDFYLEL